MTAAAAVLAEADADPSLRDGLAAALEANRRLAEMAGELREENARLREDNARLRARDAERAAELDRVRADLAVLQRMLFGRSSERSHPTSPGRDDAGGDGDRGRDRGIGQGVKRGPGARAGRRDYSHLPRFEMFWDFPGGGYCCPECRLPPSCSGWRRAANANHERSATSLALRVVMLTPRCFSR